MKGALTILGFCLFIAAMVGVGIAAHDALARWYVALGASEMAADALSFLVSYVSVCISVGLTVARLLMGRWPWEQRP